MSPAFLYRHSIGSNPTVHTPPVLQSPDPWSPTPPSTPVPSDSSCPTCPTCSLPSPGHTSIFGGPISLLTSPTQPRTPAGASPPSATTISTPTRHTSTPPG